MDRPVLVGIADGPHHKLSESLCRADFVLFGEWPSTFEPKRLSGECLPKNWRYAPLAVCSEQPSGSHQLAGLLVVWGPDNKDLAEIVTNSGYRYVLLIITESGDGSACIAAKSLGHHVEHLEKGRLQRVSHEEGVVEVFSNIPSKKNKDAGISGQKVNDSKLSKASGLKKAPKQAAKEKKSAKKESSQD